MFLSIFSKTFLTIANAIEKIFPGEKASTYYTPYCSNGEEVVPTSGSIWEHYNYLKGVLIEKNLLLKPQSKRQRERCLDPAHDREFINIYFILNYTF